METFPRPRGKIVTQLPRIFFSIFFFFFFLLILSFFLLGWIFFNYLNCTTRSTIKYDDRCLPLFLFSHLQDYQWKSLHRQNITLLPGNFTIFFPLLNVGRFLDDFLLLPLPPALESKGCRTQNTFDYKNFWERSSKKTSEKKVQFLWPRQEITPLSAMKCWDAVLQTGGPSFGMQQLFQISRYPPKPETLKSPSSFHKIGCCSTVHIYELRVKLGCDMWREWDEVMNEINLTLL